MPIVRRSRRLSDQTLPDPLDQCVPGGFNYLDIPYPAAEPLVEHPAATTVTHDPPLSSQIIEYLSAFADLREVAPPDLHSQCRRRKGKNGNAPRPPNAFMLFRSDFWRFNKEKIPERDHRQISRIAAHCWNALDEPRRIPYQELARKLKDEHAQLYPQHKYNLSAKEKAAKKAKKEFGDDELCGVIAAQVAQDVRASKSSKTSVSSGLLDQVVERKVNLKRPRSASATTAVEGVPTSESQPSQPPAKKRKRNLHKPSIVAAPASVVQLQTGPSHLPTQPFVPTDKIPALYLPPSPDLLAIKVEPLQDLVVEVSAQISVKKEPTLSPPPMVAPQKMGSPELEVPERPASISPLFYPIDYGYPGCAVEYLPPQPANPVIDEGLQFSKDYELSVPIERFDCDIFEHLGDGPTLSETYSELIALEWVHNF